MQKSLASREFSDYNLPMNDTMFAIYNRQAVQVIEIFEDEREALISFDCGKEEYVSLDALSFI